MSGERLVKWMKEKWVKKIRKINKEKKEKIVAKNGTEKW